jgi:carotenoid 1,2-hydratase
VFSPYYAWSGRKDPLNHCAVNVALYGPKAKRWSMTERGRGSVTREAHALAIGPSALVWDGTALAINIDEVTVPFPSRLRGAVRLVPHGLNAQTFPLDASSRHAWRPIAPSASVAVDFSHPGLRWKGSGYLDTNAGDEPLEAAFRSWTWSRASLSNDGAAILYDARRKDGSDLSLALRFDRSGRYESMAAPAIAQLPKTRWRIERHTRSDDAAARVLRDFEDTPFYSRSLIESRLFSERVASVHESLSLIRFSQPIVRAMLPFRMPRR